MTIAVDGVIHPDPAVLDEHLPSPAVSEAGSTVLISSALLYRVIPVASGFFESPTSHTVYTFHLLTTSTVLKIANSWQTQVMAVAQYPNQYSILLSPAARGIYPPQHCATHHSTWSQHIRMPADRVLRWKCKAPRGSLLFALFVFYVMVAIVPSFVSRVYILI